MVLFDNALSPHLRSLMERLWKLSGAEDLGIDRDEFCRLLQRIGERDRFGRPERETVSPREQASFFERLHIQDIALAHACANGSEAAWRRFESLYRGPIERMAVRIAGPGRNAIDLAGSVYGDLFGLREKDGKRLSPLARYSGRGTLLAWLSTVMTQQYINEYRRHRRETELDEHEEPSAPSPETNSFGLSLEHHTLLNRTVEEILQTLSPGERLLLISYYLEERSVREVATLLDRHGATISRRLNGLAKRLRKCTVRALRGAGLSSGEIEKAMETDIRDLDVPVRKILQHWGSQTFIRIEEIGTAGGGNHEE